MPDSTPVLLADWFGRGLSTVVGAGVTALTMIFVSRKNAEASLLEAVNKRITGQFERQDAEIENLKHTVETEREECERKLAAMRAEIAALMAGPPASYSTADVANGVRVGRAAQARQRSKSKPGKKP